MPDSEIIRDWYTSSACGANNSCLEARTYADGSVEIRNSQDPKGTLLRFTEDEWSAFLVGARAGEFSTGA
jgi:hypothetical protein